MLRKVTGAINKTRCHVVRVADGDAAEEHICAGREGVRWEKSEVAKKQREDAVCRMEARSRGAGAGVGLHSKRCHAV